MPIDRTGGGDEPPEPADQPDRQREQADHGRAYGDIDPSKVSEKELASYFGIDLDEEPQPIELDKKARAADQAQIADRSPEGEGFQKITRGVWYSSEPGWGDIESGGKNPDRTPDELAVKADELLLERVPQRKMFGVLDAKDHVEMKLAARMVRDEIELMTVVINRPVCTGPLSCDALVKKVLPVGYKLRVYEPGDGPSKLIEGTWEGTG